MASRRKILRYGPDGPEAINVDAGETGQAPLSDGDDGFFWSDVNPSTGPTGPTGNTGPTGATGADGLNGGVISGSFTQAANAGTVVGNSAIRNTVAVVGAVATLHQVILSPGADSVMDILALGWARVSSDGVITYLLENGLDDSTIIEWDYRLIPRA